MGKKGDINKIPFIGHNNSFLVTWADPILHDLGFREWAQYTKFRSM